MFPIGHLDKKRVREIAVEAGLQLQRKKILLVSVLSVKETSKNFLGQYLPAQPGAMKTMDGKQMGTS